MKKSGCFPYILVILISSIAAFIVAGALDNMAIEIPDLNDDTIRTIIDGLEDNIKEGFDKFLNNDKDNVTEDTEDAGEDTETESDPAPIVLPDNTENPILYYDQLSAEEKKVYDVVYAGLVSGEKSFQFENVPHDAYYDICFRVIRAVTYDHPELFWVKCGYRFMDSHFPFEENGDVTMEAMLYTFWDYTLDKDQKMQALQNAVSDVASQAAKYQTDFERIQFVHDYLVENAIYDHDGLSEYYKSMHDPACEYIFTAYGCLIDGKTVCSGYAKAFQMIMQKMGYNCLYVVGEAGESHAWNCIFVEDEGYFVDITWDDHDYVYDEPVYEYFCITSEALARTHTLEPDFTFPECTAEEMNYFRYNGYLLETYNFQDVKEVLEKQMGQHIVSVQFTNVEAAAAAYEELLSNGKCYDIPMFSNASSIRTSVNEDHYTITFYLS